MNLKPFAAKFFEDLGGI